MRLTLTALIAFGCSVVAAAQSLETGSRELMPRPTIGLPLPSIGLPLPPIGLPLPPIGFERQPLPRANVGLPPAPATLARGRRSRAAVIFFVPSFGWSVPPGLGYSDKPSAPLESRSAPQDKKRTTGIVRLELQPGVVPQIYVDGYYVGMLDDYVNGELTLEVGAHRIELRADGYETLELNVDVSADRPITYRGAMKRVALTPPSASSVSASPAAPPPAPSTIYVIPGCYVGNVPPADAALPAKCDAASAIAFEPRP